MTVDKDVRSRTTGEADAVEQPIPHKVYRAVRESIIRGEYPPHLRLSEENLAKELGVSRVPLREGFRMLSRDGFIHQRPHRSAVVREWTPDQVSELYDVRLVFEVKAAGLAAQRVAGGGDPRPLWETLDSIRDGQAPLDPLTAAELSTRFHRTMVELTENPLLISIVEPLFPQMVWHSYLTRNHQPGVSHREHATIAEAITAGDPALAEATTYVHIRRGREMSLKAAEH
ncbi:GntR family transcriptional regulator [Pseudactinotalea sp. HY158]|uniref:GntR family transcriptional regulator n=1 Tax=Pseudactinotalea sp. HY158 TaxID=2654547 RepID=UPI0018920CFF|nr:GntR family transcriptional regulator [Pseudactinotalea sp. HY158]